MRFSSLPRSGVASHCLLLASAVLLSSCGRGPDRPAAREETAKEIARTAVNEGPRPVGETSPVMGGPLPATRVGPVDYLASGLTPFAANCDGVPASGFAYVSAEVEPHLAINPLRPDTMVGIWQQDRWSNGSARGLVSATSLDGGHNWTRKPLPFSRCGGGNGINGGNYARASDPWVSYSPNGVVHAMSLSTSGGSFQPGSANAMLASRSFDDGRTWSNPVTLILDGEAAFNDKNTLTADPFNANYVYAVWDRLIVASDSGPTYFARSTNGGVSWEPARPIHDPGQGNQTIGNVIVVLPGGALVNVFNQIDRPPGAMQRSRVAVIRSFDRGLTWSAPVFVADLLGVGTRDPQGGGAVRDGAILPQIAVTPGGDLYVVWQDSRFSNGSIDGIAISRSGNGGLSWTQPTRVNARVNVPAFTPSVHVDRNGTVGVTYYDLRNDTATAALLTDYWLARSSNSGSTWSELRLTQQPFDLLTAPNANGYFAGDYEGLSSANGRFVPFYARTNSGNSANRTDVFAVSLANVPDVAGTPMTTAAMLREMQARGVSADFRITSQLRMRVDRNLRRRLRMPPTAGTTARTRPHFSVSVQF
jgi:hypothetical protein